MHLADSLRYSVPRICFVLPVVLVLLSTGFLGTAQELPAGFGAERYADLWKRNPFTLPTVAPKLAQPSRFETMFLTSWLKEGAQDVIFVQHLDTSEVERITDEPNKSNLRLIRIETSSDPRFVNAWISDGKEQGAVKFRLETQADSQPADFSSIQKSAKSAVVPVGSPTGIPRNPLPLPSEGPLIKETVSVPSAPAVDPSITHRIYPGIPRVHTEGGPARTLPPPEFRQKYALPTPTQSNSGQN